MDIFGVVTGTLSVAALFNTCVECFEYIQLGRHFGEHYERCQLRLDVARIRLGRWGEAVQINENPRFETSLPGDQPIWLVREVLDDLGLLFHNALRSSKRYQLDTEQGYN